MTRSSVVLSPAPRLVDPPATPAFPATLGARWSKRYRFFAALVEAGGRASAKRLAFELDLSPRQVGNLAALLEREGVLRTGPKWARVYVLDVARDASGAPAFARATG